MLAIKKKAGLLGDPLSNCEFNNILSGHTKTYILHPRTAKGHNLAC